MSWLVANCASAAALVIAAEGCGQNTSPKYDYVIAAPTPHAIFNPSESPSPLVDFDRGDWPVAYVPDQMGEEIQYREHFVDIHDRGFDHDDGYIYRRFESNRYGRSRR